MLRAIALMISRAASALRVESPIGKGASKFSPQKSLGKTPEEGRTKRGEGELWTR